MCTEIQMVFISALAGNVIQWLCIFFHSRLKVNIAHHYSQVPYLHVHPLSKMYFNPQVALHCISSHFQKCAKLQENWVAQHSCCQLKWNKEAACLFQLPVSHLETGRGWKQEEAVQCKKLLSWGQLEEFESQLGLLLIGQPQVSNLTLVNMLFSFVKERK